MLAKSIGLAFVLSIGPVCMVAHAAPTTYFEDLPAEAQDAVIDYAYDRSPVAAVPYPSASSEAANLDAALAELATSADAGAADVAAGEWGLLSRAALVPEMSAAFPDITLAAGTFQLGWQIGTGARKLFVKLLGPSDAGTGGTWQWQGLRWYRHGTEVFFGATVQQTPGAYLYDAYYGGDFHPARWFEAPCTFSGFAPPGHAHLQTGLASYATCYVAPNSYPIYVDYPYLNREDIKPKQAIHPFDQSTDGTPTKISAAPADPGTSSVTSAIAGYLDSDDGAAMRSELDWEIDGARDPMTNPTRFPYPWTTPPDDQWERWCERSAPGTGYEGLDQTTSEFSVFQTFPAQSLGSADMLYGTDAAYTTDSFHWLNIQGFGIRKIAAKHGWGATDELETAETLANPAYMTGPTTPYGRYKYYGATYAPDPARVPAAFLPTGTCRRVVVVDTQAQTGEPRSRGIITSYGDWTGETP